MAYSEIITRLPQADVPFEGVTGYMLKSPNGLQVFFEFMQETIVPPHSHGAQWGTVVEGELTLTIDGNTRTYRPGDTYTIGAGVIHSAEITAGTRLIDFFEEPERYQEKQ